MKKNKYENNQDSIDTEICLDLEFANLSVRNNEEIVRKIVKNNGKSFQYASERLKDDKGFVLEMIPESHYIIRFVSERLKNDEDIVFTSLKCDHTALGYVNERFSKDGNLVLKCLKTNAYILRDLDDKFQNDFEVLEIYKFFFDENRLHISELRFYNEKMKALENYKEQKIMMDKIDENLKESKIEKSYGKYKKQVKF